MVATKTRLSVAQDGLDWPDW